MSLTITMSTSPVPEQSPTTSMIKVMDNPRANDSTNKAAIKKLISIECTSNGNRHRNGSVLNDSLTSGNDLLDLERLNHRFELRSQLRILGSISFITSTFSLIFQLYQLIVNHFGTNETDSSGLVITIIALSCAILPISLLLLCPIVNNTLTTHLLQSIHPSSKTSSPERNNGNNSNVGQQYISLVNNLLFHFIFIILASCCTILVYCLAVQMDRLDLPSNQLKQSLQMNQSVLLALLYGIVYTQLVLPFTLRLNLIIQMICFLAYICHESFHVMYEANQLVIDPTTRNQTNEVVDILSQQTYKLQFQIKKVGYIFQIS